MKKILIALFCASIVSCQKEEPRLQGQFITDQVGRADMLSEGGVNYQKQLYFDLSSGELKALEFS
ncbi:MAG: hypothetical protein U5L96_04945 [Owenweeksia sp.]|nr:hypothetical protein [Owenweeksia sp.]